MVLENTTVIGFSELIFGLSVIDLKNKIMNRDTSWDDPQLSDGDFPSFKKNINKKYILEKIFISELNYLMITLYNKEKQVWTTLNLGDWKKQLNFNSSDINIEEIETKK